MYYRGFARLGKKTKDLVKRLKPYDIAIINHKDIDKVSAEGLVEKGIEVVINAQKSISGRYPNLGPILIASAGIHLIDNVGLDIFTDLKDGDQITIQDEKILLDNKIVGKGHILTVLEIQRIMKNAEENLGLELEKFASNTLQYIQKEKEFLIEGSHIPEIVTNMRGKHVLVVTRGYEYREDLMTLRSYIREFKPILIGVDGGADALIEEGYKPNLIIGDMDSVSDKALLSGAELIVHAYLNGQAPGADRIKELKLEPILFQSPGTSEDLALLLAYEKGAELIVAVGTHANIIEFLDKGRDGMASTFLIRLKVGNRLVDAKGVNNLYQAKVKIFHLILLIFAALITLTIIIISSPTIQHFLRLLIMDLRYKLNI